MIELDFKNGSFGYHKRMTHVESRVLQALSARAMKSASLAMARWERRESEALANELILRTRHSLRNTVRGMLGMQLKIDQEALESLARLRVGAIPNAGRPQDIVYVIEVSERWRKVAQGLSRVAVMIPETELNTMRAWSERIGTYLNLLQALKK